MKAYIAAKLFSAEHLNIINIDSKIIGKSFPVDN